MCIRDRLYTENNLGGEFGIVTEPLHADFTFRDGDEIDFHGCKFRVLETAGHSAGSVCFITELGIFSGDTLFCGGVGRTDFYLSLIHICTTRFCFPACKPPPNAYMKRGRRGSRC